MIEDAELEFKKTMHVGTQAIQFLAQTFKALPGTKHPEIHMIEHSAGAIWLDNLLQRWQILKGTPVESLQLLAPACTMDFYRSHISAYLAATQVKALMHYINSSIGVQIFLPKAAPLLVAVKISLHMWVFNRYFSKA